MNNKSINQKERVDVLLVEQGFFTSREKAKAAVMAGLVFINEEKVDKAGMKVARTTKFTVKGNELKYVGRGGLKLEKAIQQFGIDFNGKTVVDVGASTGGFTDCALQHGAAWVYAIDVGYNQLAWSLRQDPRVKVMERTNFRYIEASDLQGPVPDIATIDVSFISLRKIFPPLPGILAEQGEVVALVKPQFEAGKEYVGRKGVVRDKAVHVKVLTDIVHSLAAYTFELKGLTYSPITGGEGNIEFLTYWKRVHDRAPQQTADLDRWILQTVEDAAAHFAR